MNIDLLTIADFQEIIINKLPLSSSLFFLDASVWQPGNAKKEEKLLKYIAAIANNNGQFLIIGIKTKNKRAQQFEYINTNSISEIWLKQLIYTQIQPKLDDLKIKILSVEENKGIIIVSFKPNNRPYMYNDGRYYTLHNQNIYFMKEDEVKRLYLIQHKPIVDLVGIINTQGIALLENGLPVEINFYPKFIIKNSGTAIEKHYKVEIQIPSSLHDVEFNPLQMFFNRIDGAYSVFTIPSKNPIYQNEVYTVAEAKVCLKNTNLNDFLNLYVHVTIFYSEGTSKHSFKLSEIFSYNKKNINSKIFYKEIK